MFYSLKDFLTKLNAFWRHWMNQTSSWTQIYILSEVYLNTHDDPVYSINNLKQTKTNGSSRINSFVKRGGVKEEREKYKKPLHQRYNKL